MVDTGPDLACSLCTHRKSIAEKFLKMVLAFFRPLTCAAWTVLATYLIELLDAKILVLPAKIRLSGSLGDFPVSATKKFVLSV